MYIDLPLAFPDDRACRTVVTDISAGSGLTEIVFVAAVRSEQIGYILSDLLGKREGWRRDIGIPVRHWVLSAFQNYPIV